MKAKDYPALIEALEIAIPCGYRRAHKHVDHPTEEAIFQAIEDAVVNEICERFELDEPTQITVLVSERREG